MPKEWGTNQPTISDFQRAVPKTSDELLTNLKALGENWGYVNYCGVVSQLKGIFVDLNRMANGIGKTPDFYLPVKAAEIAKADSIVKSIVAKVENKQPIVSQDAVALFPTLETA